VVSWVVIREGGADTVRENPGCTHYLWLKKVDCLLYCEFLPRNGSFSGSATQGSAGTRHSAWERSTTSIPRSRKSSIYGCTSQGSSPMASSCTHECRTHVNSGRYMRGVLHPQGIICSCKHLVSCSWSLQDTVVVDAVLNILGHLRTIQPSIMTQWPSTRSALWPPPMGNSQSAIRTCLCLGLVVEPVLDVLWQMRTSFSLFHRLWLSSVSRSQYKTELPRISH
jgi:hypothetical protein